MKKSVCPLANCPPLIIHEHIRLFAYYWNGEVCTGMMWQGRMFGFHTCLTEHQRHQLHESGYELSNQADIVISVSSGCDQKYYVWLDLTTLKDLSLLSKGSAFSPVLQAKVSFDPACVQSVT